MPVPTFTAAGTAAWTASNSATFIPTVPTGVDGDLLLLIIERNDTTAAPTVTGWTNIAGLTGTNGTQSTAVYWKLAVGTTETGPTVTFGSSTVARGGVILRFNSASPLTPVHLTSLLNVASTATTVNATNITSTIANTLGLFVASMIGQRSTTNTTTNWSAGAGVTAFASQNTTVGADLTIGYGEKSFAVAGSFLTPGIIWTTNTTTGVGQGLLLAITPIQTPNVPTSSAADGIGISGFNANWSAVTTDSTHDAVTGYLLDVATDSGFTSLVAGYNGLNVGTVIKAAVGPLSPGTAYWYRVSATNAGGTSAVSASQNPTTLTKGANPSGNYATTIFNEPGLMAYYRLGETGGATTAVDTASAFNLAYTSVTLAQTGALVGDSDTAASFNGTTSQALDGTTAQLLVPSNFTLECWVKPTDTTTRGTLINKGDGNSAATSTFRLEHDAAGKINFSLASAASSFAIAGATVLSTSAWTYVVATLSGGVLSIYLNGNATPDNTSNPPVVLPPNPCTTGFGLGALNAGGNTLFYLGLLDEVAIYNTALTTGQMADHYAKGQGMWVPPFTRSQYLSHLAQPN